MYSNMLWRIVKINKDNTVTLISENVIGTLNNGKDTYEKSSVITWLNKEKEKDYSGVVENVLSNKDSFLVKSNICTDTINDVNKITCNKTNHTYDIGLLSIEDYLYTGGNKGFINNGKITYLANQSKNKNYWYITNEGKLDSDSENEIIADTKAHSYRISNAIKNSKKMKQMKIISLLNDLAKLDYQLKSDSTMQGELVLDYYLLHAMKEKQ